MPDPQPAPPDPHRGPAARVAGLITRRAALIVVLALLLGALAFQGARRLGIDQELRAMLPDHAPSVVRLDAAAARLGNQSDLYVTIRSPSRAANVAFGTKLAATLEQRDDMRYVLFHRDPSFFKRNALLYAKLGDLLEIRGRVIAAIQARVRRELSAFPEDEPPLADTELQLDEAELRRRYHLEDEPPAYFEADEGRVLVVRARPTYPNTDIARARGLFADVNAAIAATDPAAHHPAMDVQIDGSYALHTRLAGDLQRDIINGSLAAFALLLLTVAAYFRGLRAVPLVLTPLLISAFTALAFAAAVYGELNLVSAFIFAVQLGLGIDFGTHMLARHRDELARGSSHRQAIATAVATTGVSTAGGALSTAFSFLLLALAEFRGFTQFGVVAFVGILVAYLAAIVVLPALVVLFDRVWPWRVRPKPAAGSFTRADPRPVPALALAVLAACLGLGALGASQAAKIGFEYDLNKLDVPDDRSEAELARTREFRGAVGKIQSRDGAVVLTSDLAQTRELHRQLQAIHELRHDEIAAITGLPPLTPDAEPPPPKPAPEPAPKPDDPDDDDDEPEVEPDDPRFIELRRIADDHAQLAPETRAALAHYPPDRLREMDDLLTSVLSIYSFIPDLQAEKLEVIRDIRSRIDKKRGSLSADDTRKLATWERYLEVDRPVEVADLPAWVRVQFTDMDGQLGRFVALWHTGPTADYVHAKRIHEAFDTLDTSRGPVPAVANYYVIPEIVDTIRGDGPLVVSAVFGVLILTAFLMFRRVGQTLFVLLTVGLALLWLAGLFVLLGWKLNLFNLIALPLLIGMGQDDSLHIIHRYREEGPGSLRFVLRETGGAVFLTTLTTVIGFSSMLFVQHQGLRSLGLTACIGMTLCLISSVLVVPSALRISEWLAARRR